MKTTRTLFLCLLTCIVYCCNLNAGEIDLSNEEEIKEAEAKATAGKKKENESDEWTQISEALEEQENREFKEKQNTCQLETPKQMSEFFERHQLLFQKARQAHVLKWGLQHKAATAFPSGMWVAQQHDDYPLMARHNENGSLDPQDSPGTGIVLKEGMKRDEVSFVKEGVELLEGELEHFFSLDDRGIALCRRRL